MLFIRSHDQINQVMNILLLASWSFMDIDGTFYTPQVHKIYLDYACQRYAKVYIITPVKKAQHLDTKYSPIDAPNLRVIAMPYFKSHAGAQRYFFSYRHAIKAIEGKVDIIYCRVPDPFAWMPALITDKPVIMHFVGDTIDATKHNQLWSPLKRKFMITAYQPERALINKAARKANKVLTNGEHIAKRLRKHGVNAKSIISSTISSTDFPSDLHVLQTSPVRLTYVGYLRGAKGIDTLITTIRKLKDGGIDFFFNVVGDGDMYRALKKLSHEKELDGRIKLWGFVNDRDHLFQILRNTDLFFFPSLSEGSPRVVIEAMSQGVPVMSTPVGSLPSTFNSPSEIRFFPTNDAEKAYDIIRDYTLNSITFDEMRHHALNKVKDNFTTEQFFSQIFNI